MKPFPTNRIKKILCQRFTSLLLARRHTIREQSTVHKKTDMNHNFFSSLLFTVQRTHNNEKYYLLLLLLFVCWSSHSVSMDRSVPEVSQKMCIVAAARKSSAWWRDSCETAIHIRIQCHCHAVVVIVSTRFFFCFVPLCCNPRGSWGTAQ